MIRVICSKCKTPANLPDSTAGKVAVCKCGQKNPIPKPAGSAQPAAPQTPRPQSGNPPVAVPSKNPPAHSPVMVSSAAPADDLALQDLDHDTGTKKDAEPVPCPACEKPLPAGEIVCRHCGFIAQEGLMGKSKRIVNKPRPVSWGGKQPSELKVVDFLKVSVSSPLFRAIAALIFRSVLAALLMVGVAVGLFYASPFISKFLSSAPAWVPGLVIYGLLVFLCCQVYGVVVKEVFAVCQAACFGYEEPRVRDWPTSRSGLLFLLLHLVPGVIGGLVAAGAGPVAGGVLFAVSALCYVPVMFLSVSQSAGEWSGLNPVRAFQWLATLFLPYMGILGIILVEVAVVAGLGVLGLTSVGAADVIDSATRGVNWTIFAMSAGTVLALFVLLLHPLVYMAAMMGMLYRKYEKSLLG